MYQDALRPGRRDGPQPKIAGGKEEHHSMQGTSTRIPQSGTNTPVGQLACDAKGELTDGTANRATFR